MSNKQLYEVADPEYGRETFDREERFEHRKERRAPAGRRRNKSPQSFNGIHRRRKRKMNW
jgi:hypothetical protein